MQGQQYYNHGLFWIRVALTDTIGPHLKPELLLQKRTQTAEPGDKNIFATPQFNSVWFWMNYSFNSKVKIGVSPFGYFESYVLNTKPSDANILPIKEFRWAGRVELETKFKFVNFINRYSVEYRTRDLHHDGNYLPNWRMRYMMKLEKPVKGLLSSRKPVTFTVYDEVFLQFGEAVKNNPDVFDQNRLYTGVSYEVFRNVKFTLAYIYGFQERTSGEEFDNMNLLWTVVTFENVISQFFKKKVHN